MLTDIFAYRYRDLIIWDRYTNDAQRLMHQSIGILKDAMPYYDSSQREIQANKEAWKKIHDLLARELGVKELSPVYYSFQSTWNGQPHTQSGSWPWVMVCETYMTQPINPGENPDRIIKERLSLIEIGLRERSLQLAVTNAGREHELRLAKIREGGVRRGLVVSGSEVDRVQARYDYINSTFKAQVNEFNERLRRAGAPLAFHNGFIQVSEDLQIESQIAKPFWEVVADKKWENVSVDMAEALDQRDGGGKDPAFFAAKALESAIKIISDQKNWTTGSEKGVANYIDNLVSHKNGRFIEVWEADFLKEYFGKVRNGLGHGPGSAPMPILSTQQTDWAIENAMSWVRSLVKRM